MSSNESEYENLSTSGSETTISEDFSTSPDEDESEGEDVASTSQEWVDISPEGDVLQPPFEFTSASGFPEAISNCKEEYEFFNYFFDEELMQLIVDQTNLFADQFISSTPHSSTSLISSWHPTTINEMRIFFAIILVQSVVKKPEEKMYWSKSPIFETPFFAKTLSYRRFLLLKKFLHFSNNAEFVESTHPNPKLNKIWPVFEYLQRKFQQGYIPDKNVTIDESLMLYKGRLGWIQYMPLKRSRFGVKTYMLCESTSGYIWSTIIYTGKNTLFDQTYRNLPVSSQVVMSLMRPLLNKGYCLTTDNFYTSPDLAELLVRNKTDTYGTLRFRRKGVPKNISFPKKVARGYTRAYRKGKLMVMRWRDKKDVFFLSTVHSCTMVQTESGKERPTVANDYNFTMGGVDRVDQHLAIRPVTRKQGKKYYKKIFFHLLEQALWNAFVLFKKKGGVSSNSKFRENVIKQYLENYHSKEFSSKGGRPSTTPNPLRLTARHFIETIPPTAAKQNTARRCAVCCSKVDARGKKVRKETRYYCPDCDVGLCIPCFKIYHTKKFF